MAAVATPPKRTLEQQFAALAHANQIRTKRAHLKKDLKAGRIDPVEVLMSTDPDLATMRIYDVMRALPRVGKPTAIRLLRHCAVSPTKTVGGLSPRQQRELVEVVAMRSTS